jgi:hypothetical protein
VAVLADGPLGYRLADRTLIMDTLADLLLYACGLLIFVVASLLVIEMTQRLWRAIVRRREEKQDHGEEG